MADRKINSNPQAAKSVTARNSRKNNPKSAAAKAAPAAVPTQPSVKTTHEKFRLSPPIRFDPPFVIENNGKYVATSDPLAKKLTKTLRLALQFSSETEAQKYADRLTQTYVPQTWSDPFTIAQLVATRKHLVIGTTTDFSFTKDIDTPSWERCDRHTLALAESASWESESETNDENMHLHRYLLMSSPLWPLIVRLYDEERAAELAEAKVPPLVTSDALAYFAGRIFYAGVTAGRRENGKRGKYGYLVLDNPSQPEDGGDESSNGGAR